MCLWWWWSWATLLSWPKTDVSSTRLVPYSSLTPPQACVSGGQPEGSGEDLRIKLVIQHCCLRWWDCTGFVRGIASAWHCPVGLVCFITLSALQFLVPGNEIEMEIEMWLTEQAALLKPDSHPVLLFFCSTAAFSHHFITLWRWMGSLHSGRVYDPAFADRRPRYGSPSKALSDTAVTSGQQWAGLS